MLRKPENTLDFPRTVRGLYSKILSYNRKNTYVECFGKDFGIGKGFIEASK
jgi:hypothetical protein